MTLTPEQLQRLTPEEREIFERSKNDHAIIVGSEIRQLAYALIAEREKVERLHDRAERRGRIIEIVALELASVADNDEHGQQIAEMLDDMSSRLRQNMNDTDPLSTKDNQS